MRCFCGFRWSCYGEGAGKSRQANGSDRDGALDVGHFDVNAREARRGRYRSLLAPLASLLVALTLVACGHILLPPPTQTPPPPSGPQSSPTSCSVGQEWCMGDCVDTIQYMNDSANCGRCGNRCSISETCTGGFCSCAPGYESCMGRCVNSSSFISDSSNCGRCGNICSIGESCLGGSCRKL